MSETEIAGSAVITETAVAKPRGIIRRAGRYVGGKAGMAGGWIKENFMDLEKRIPLERIDPQTVAWTIHTFIKNPAREVFGMDPLSNGFDLPLLMSDMGHPARRDNEDYMDLYPNEYRACRQALQAC